MDETYDVVVVGGGSAGLSGAVALSRFRRAVLVIDAGDPRNAPAGHVHNFLTRDGTPPAELYATGREEVTRYGGRVEPGRVSAVRRDGDGFAVDLSDRTVRARRVLVATGLRDEPPDVPGLVERWGIDVLHCPYCHGWEVRDRRIGVLATGPTAVHQALLFRQLSPQVTYLEHTTATPDEEEREQLDALGIPVVSGPVVQVESEAHGLTAVRLADGTRVQLDVLVVAPRMTPRAAALAPLGLELTDVRMGDHVIGQQIAADASGATAVPGVWVAGNVGSAQAQLVTSAAAGLTAAAAINADLVAEDTRHAVQSLRFHRAYGEQAWDERYRATDRVWSGQPNPVLVAEVAELAPGTALDAGCGEGADACWLAARGWQVTGVDFAAAALDRASAHAAQAGLNVAWRHLDIAREPAPGRFDLVTAHFLHLPRELQPALVGHLADAVAPGGTLLIVGHDPSDLTTSMPRPGLAETWWTAGDVAAALGSGWKIEVAEARPRPALDPDGHEITIHDAVLCARRTTG